jgi:hypothetical protein
MNERRKLVVAVFALLVIITSSSYLYFLMDPFDRRSEEFGVAVFLNMSCKENSSKNSQIVLSYLRKHNMKVTEENFAIVRKDPTLMTVLRLRPSLIGYTYLLPPSKGKVLRQGDPDRCQPTVF